MFATIAIATALFSIIHHHPAPTSMPAQMRAALLLPHTTNTLIASHNQHGHASLCPLRRCQQLLAFFPQPLSTAARKFTTKIWLHLAKAEFSFSDASAAASSSKQQQAAASSSKQQQAAASSSKQQQAAASSSKQQQTRPAAPPPANASRMLQSCVLKRGLSIRL